MKVLALLTYAGFVISNIKYLIGNPLSYRFDGSNGVFNINGGAPLTKSGKPFSIVPIGYRIFKAELFGKKSMRWAEIFFINQNGAVSILMFHGFSVDNFITELALNYYNDLTLLDVSLVITPEKKTKVLASGDIATYYIASFEMTSLSEDDKVINHSISEKYGALLFRESTFDVVQEIQESKGFYLDFIAEMKAKKEAVKALEAGAETPGKEEEKPTAGATK